MLQKKLSRPFFVYFVSSAFIFGWWWLFQPGADVPISVSRNDYRVENASYLEPIPREELKQALEGDFSKNGGAPHCVGREAENLEHMHFAQVARLSSDEFREVIHLFKNLNGSKDIKVIPQTHIAATVPRDRAEKRRRDPDGVEREPRSLFAGKI